MEDPNIKEVEERVSKSSFLIENEDRQNILMVGWEMESKISYSYFDNCIVRHILYALYKSLYNKGEILNTFITLQNSS